MVLGKDVATKWVTYEYGSDLLKFKIRYYSSSKIDEFRKKFTTDVKGETEIDYDAWQYAALDWVILDWDGIESSKGKPAECNKASKKMLLEHHPDIVDFLIDAAKINATFRCDAEEFKKKYVKSLGISKIINLDGQDSVVMPA